MSYLTRNYQRVIQVAVGALVIFIGFASGRVLTSMNRDIAEREFRPAFVDAVRRDTLQEVVMVFMASGRCKACADKKLPEIISAAKVTLKKRVEQQGLTFSTLAVGVDRTPKEAYKELRRYGDFDEVIGGRMWSGLGVLYFGWEKHPGAVSVPQVVVLTRTLVASAGHLRVLSETLRTRVVGLSELKRWAANGFMPLDLGLTSP